MIKNRVFYHVTIASNYNEIMKNGLIPKIGSLSSDANEEVPRVYLFTSLENMNDGLSSWLGIAYEDLLNEIKDKLEEDENIKEMLGYSRDELLDEKPPAYL